MEETNTKVKMSEMQKEEELFANTYRDHTKTKLVDEIHTEVEDKAEDDTTTKQDDEKDHVDPKLQEQLDKVVGDISRKLQEIDFEDKDSIHFGEPTNWFLKKLESYGYKPIIPGAHSYMCEYTKCYYLKKAVGRYLQTGIPFARFCYLDKQALFHYHPSVWYGPMHNKWEPTKRDIQQGKELREWMARGGKIDEELQHVVQKKHRKVDESNN